MPDHCCRSGLGRATHVALPRTIAGGAEETLDDCHPARALAIPPVAECLHPGGLTLRENDGGKCIQDVLFILLTSREGVGVLALDGLGETD